MQKDIKHLKELAEQNKDLQKEINSIHMVLNYYAEKYYHLDEALEVYIPNIIKNNKIVELHVQNLKIYSDAIGQSIGDFQKTSLASSLVEIHTLGVKVKLEEIMKELGE